MQQQNGLAVSRTGVAEGDGKPVGLKFWHGRSLIPRRLNTRRRFRFMSARNYGVCFCCSAQECIAAWWDCTVRLNPPIVAQGFLTMKKSRAASLAAISLGLVLFAG